MKIDLQQTKPVESWGEKFVATMLVLASIGGLLYAASRFF